MTDKKISELTSITGANVSDANDVLPIVDTSAATTKKITRAELFKSVGNVGIGTSSPASPLHVQAADAVARVQATGNTGGQVHFVNTASPTPFIVGLTGSTTGDGLIYHQEAKAIFFGTNNVNRMCIHSSGNVGIGTSLPAANLSVSSSSLAALSFSSTAEATDQKNWHFQYGTGIGAGTFRLRAINDANTSGQNAYIITRSGIGVQTHQWLTAGIGRMSIDSSGNVTIGGSLSKGSGSFKIDHPLKPDTHHLVHSFIEGPQADNIYRGKVALVGGKATVNLDEAGRMTEGTFVALNGNVQCFTSNEDGWTAVRGKVDGNILTIEAQDAICTDTVSWLVIGERHDQHMIDADWTDEQGRIITEPEKVTAS